MGVHAQLAGFHPFRSYLALVCLIHSPEGPDFGVLLYEFVSEIRPNFLLGSRNFLFGLFGYIQH